MLQHKGKDRLQVPIIDVSLQREALSGQLLQVEGGILQPVAATELLQLGGEGVEFAEVGGEGHNGDEGLQEDGWVEGGKSGLPGQRRETPMGGQGSMGVRAEGKVHQVRQKAVNRYRKREGKIGLLTMTPCHRRIYMHECMGIHMHA